MEKPQKAPPIPIEPKPKQELWYQFCKLRSAEQEEILDSLGAPPMQPGSMRGNEYIDAQNESAEDGRGRLAEFWDEIQKRLAVPSVKPNPFR